MSKTRKKLCVICKKKFDEAKTIPLILLTDPIFELIQKDHPKISHEDHICLKDMGHYRALYIKQIVTQEKKIITEDEEPVIESFIDRTVISENVDDLYEESTTFADRLSDKVSAFVGSWPFIISFFIFMILWISLNSYAIATKPLDPYPYIFLNLILSTIAATQAPLIMMSQNRQEAKDRVRSEHDYKINLKAELEIRHLNGKLDHYMRILWEHLEENERFNKSMSLNENMTAFLHRHKQQEVN
ncbi:MAG: DUF1003 domain-containing protein [Alphaproteobacteria bacterium]|nr:DUF1003 domain-containing protein [Alphaproteobacteria bacterium]